MNYYPISLYIFIAFYMYNSTVKLTLAVVIPRIRATMGWSVYTTSFRLYSEQLDTENKLQDWMIWRGGVKKKEIFATISKVKKKTKTRNEKRVKGQYISSSLVLLYTNYKIVVSDYCQPHHTKRPSMHSARMRARDKRLFSTISRIFESHSSGRFEFLSRGKTARRRMGRLIGSDRRRR